jgi:sugar phosphate isomerase/epimerase
MSKFIISAFGDEISPELKTQMDILEEHGINFIEMRGIDGKGIVTYTLEEVVEIKKQLDRRGFKISAIGSPIGKIGITDEFEPHLNLFRHTLKIAKILETKYIRMFSFYIPEGSNADDYRVEVIARWKEFIKAAEGSGLILLHENEKGIYGDTDKRCLDLLESLNCSYMKAIFDPANFVQCNVETYPEAYHLLKPYIEYIHIKDALNLDHSVTPAGFGDGKLKEILAELYKTGFEGFLSLEPHLGSFAGLAGLEKNSKVNSMPEGGPKQFSIAAESLKNIINEIYE